MKIAIIDYGAGNIQSIQFALERLGFEGILTNDVEGLMVKLTQKFKIDQTNFKSLNDFMTFIFNLFIQIK